MFSKKSKLAALTAGVLTMSMLFAACTPVADQALYPGTPGKDTAVINLATEPRDLCSITTTDTVSMDVLRHVVDGLTILDKNDKAIGGVAKDWTVSDDGLVYTFNLRDDYKWSNGEKVTAHDFEFSFKALVDPAFASEYAYLGYIIKNSEAFSKGEAKREDIGAKALDDTTFELTLEYPATYIPELLAFASFNPINQKGYEEIGEGYGTDANKIITNGQYNLSKWTHNTEVELVKNKDYPYATDTKIEKITMMMIKDVNTEMNSFKSNELDMITLNSEQMAQMEKEGQEIYNFNDGAVSYLEFNLNDPMLKNVKIRKAIAYAIDSESFVKNVVGNNSIAAASFTPVGILGNKKDFSEELGPMYKIHDVEAAKKLLEEGMKEEGLNKISLTFLTEDSETAGKYAAFLQENLQKDLGIEIKIETMPFMARIDRLVNRDFQVSMSLWGPDYNDPMTYLDLFMSTGGNNHGGYVSEEYDALLNNVRNEPDRGKRFEYLMELEKVLAKDMPIAPYFFRSKDYTTSAKLKGVVRTTFQSINMRWASLV